MFGKERVGLKFLDYAPRQKEEDESGAAAGVSVIFGHLKRRSRGI